MPQEHELAVCSHGAEQFSGPERLFAIKGCTQELIRGNAAFDGRANVSADSTGLRFFFELGAAEPETRAIIAVTNGSHSLLSDELVFRAGHLVDREVQDEFDVERGVVTTELYFSICNASEVQLGLSPNPIIGPAAATVHSFDHDDKEGMLESGRITCNGYWQGRA